MNKLVKCGLDFVKKGLFFQVVMVLVVIVFVGVVGGSYFVMLVVVGVLISILLNSVFMVFVFCYVGVSKNDFVVWSFS